MLMEELHSLKEGESVSSACNVPHVGHPTRIDTTQDHHHRHTNEHQHRLYHVSVHHGPHTTLQSSIDAV